MSRTGRIITDEPILSSVIDDDMWIDVWTIQDPYYDYTKMPVINRGCFVESDRLIHRFDAPAIIRYYDEERTKVAAEQWLEEGGTYRLDGPAWIVYNPQGDVEQCVWHFGTQLYYSFEEWLAYADPLGKAKEVELKLKYG